MNGWCRGYIVDVSKREEVYKAAEDIKTNVGDVSTHVLKLSIQFKYQREIQLMVVRLKTTKIYFRNVQINMWCLAEKKNNGVN